MSEEILKVFLADLKTIRVTCQNPHCNVVIEMQILPTTETSGDGLGAKMAKNKCPVCDHDFVWLHPAMQGYNPFAAAEKLFRYLEGAKDKIRIEFPVKIENDR